MVRDYLRKLTLSGCARPRRIRGSTHGAASERARVSAEQIWQSAQGHAWRM